MTDRELNFQTMSLATLGLLTDTRPQWEPLYPKMLPDFEALQTALGVTDAAAQKLSGLSSAGYADAKDLAEIAALDAAVPVLRGLKALQLDKPRPELAELAAHTRSSLDELRGLPQVAALEELYNQALPLAKELKEELVTADHLKKLHDKTALFKPLLGTPRQQTTEGSREREKAVASLGAARAALKRLDVRVPNLSEALPELVARYKKARMIVDAGHGPTGDAPQA
ncbi:hypothetical protein Q5H93_21860 [Hymenobacter sp. ASUV-10]|uniref:Uncharacterized protein n=1 Tax=Hymenobacter aranciens TaxID=3063996 RepID=A0ABT9BGM5_9BACT|nr:hypothetical protein [Hymenobacter sp. ASUV-10]MDO7877402.1 hypothetical protein [Hymenobacter sp. ASUV-10]